MRKISTNCRLRCFFCRAVFAGLLCAVFDGVQPIVYAQVIAEPGVPVAAPPPVIPRERDPVKIRREQKLERQEAEQKEEQVSKVEVASKKAEEEKKREATQPRPLYGFVELSLIQPKAVVSKGRSKYICDLTSHINAYVRLFWNDEASVVQPWAGFRIAPINGYGTQNRTTARFSHTWMGPAIGFGKIFPPADASSDYPTREMFLWSAGLAAVSRLSPDGEVYTKSDRDFESTPWSLDPPGLWSELRWTHLYGGAVGTGVLVGAQSGEGKVFYYAGLSFSGFY